MCIRTESVTTLSGTQIFISFVSFSCNMKGFKVVKMKSFVVPSPQVGVQTSQMEMLPTNIQMLSWESYDEDITSLDDSSTITAPGLLEQINVTRDSTDYLWYITR